jgi:SAM-dependent methyltransferase
MSKGSETLDLKAPLAFDAGYADWKEWKPEQFGQYSTLDAQYFAAEFAIDVPSRARVLEIGFGNGASLAWLKAIGADVYGVEANPLLVERAERLFGVGRAFNDLGAAELKPLAGTFTHVIGMDVVEHVPLGELPGLLCRVRDLLAADGKVILRFPNGDSPFGRIYQHGDPSHVTTLGGARLTFLAAQAGLQPEVIRAPALPVRGVGFVRGCRRLAILTMRALIERCMGQLYFGGRRVPLDPNYTAVLRRGSARPV